MNQEALTKFILYLLVRNEGFQDVQTLGPRGGKNQTRVIHSSLVPYCEQLQPGQLAEVTDTD